MLRYVITRIFNNLAILLLHLYSKELLLPLHKFATKLLACKLLNEIIQLRDLNLDFISKVIDLINVSALEQSEIKVLEDRVVYEKVQTPRSVKLRPIDFRLSCGENVHKTFCRKFVT
jgi:hypothetical protein